jgi:predicted PurR-regulated permease PerM
MATTETKRLTMMLFYAYVLALAFFAFQIMRPFVTPLIWAGILALCMWPLQKKLMRRYGEARAALMVTILALLLVIGPVFWIVYSLVSQASQVIIDLHGSLLKVESMEKVKALWDRLGAQVPLPAIEELRSRFVGVAGSLTSVVAGQAAGILQNLAEMLFKTVITFLAMFFFLRDGERASGAVRNFLPFSEEQQTRLIRQT